MKISINGAPIEHGHGLDAVCKKIHSAFREIYSDLRADIQSNEREIEIVEEVDTAPVPDNPLRPLAESADPILRVAERHFQHAVARRHHHNAVYRISVPTETAQELF